MILTKVKETASKIKHDNTTHVILVNRDKRQGNFGGLSSLSYIPIKAYRTAVLGCQDQFWVGAKG